MKHLINSLTGLCLLFCCLSCDNQLQDSKANFEKPWLLLTLDSTKLLVSEVVQNLDQPWEITWGPDEHLWFTERKGNVYRMNPQTGDKKKVLTLSDVYSEGLTPGLLGMVLHPDFKTDPFVYLHYTCLLYTSPSPRDRG